MRARDQAAKRHSGKAAKRCVFAAGFAADFAFRGFAALVLLLGVCACDRRPAGATPTGASAAMRLRIAAASSMKRPLEEMAGQFEARYPGKEVALSFGASGTLYAQLTNQAPFDLFLSADTSYPQKLVEGGHTLEPGSRVYAVGTLVLWAPASRNLDLAANGAAALTRAAVRKVAIANPQHAPYGRAAEAAMKALKIEEAVRPKLVLGENVEQTAQFAQSGAADAAFIPLSLAVQPGLRDHGETWRVPDDAYAPIEHAFVILSWAEDQAVAREFAAFLLGPDGRAIVTSHGLAPPEP